MKALLILIVAAGTVQGNSLGPNQTLQVREIEFSSLETCYKAAAKLTNAARKTSDYVRTFSIERSTSRVLVPTPVVIAECVQR